MQNEAISVIQDASFVDASPIQHFITNHFPWLALIIVPFLKLGSAIKIASVISLFVLSTFFDPLYASPQDGVVAAGDASISQSGTYTQITQTSDRAIINWQSFNVGSNEHVHFQQPSSSSVTLNRINPANGASQIYGRITATGQVWLTNPAGIFFGPHAQIDVAGLLATTANIRNEDFMAGRHQFTQSPDWHGAIINEGNIRAADYGMVALVAPAVVNRGIIQARLGKIALAAGNQFTVDFYGDQLINFGVAANVTQSAKDMNGNEVKAGVTNSGSVIADGGKILMSARVAKDIVDHVINMEGVAQAKAVMQKGGEIVLLGGDEGVVRVAGKLDASGSSSDQFGGTIKVLGNKILLNSPTIIDVSGDMGGGTILVGGNAHGLGVEPTAQYVLVAGDTYLNASALTQGDGGKIVIWSDEGTAFYGNILAQGGAQSGNGGFVEVSGGKLAFNGSVNTYAPNGLVGTLLLDPNNITIQTGGSATINDVNQFADTSGGNDPIIDPSTIEAVTGSVVLQANNTITLNNSINRTNAGSLTMQAGNSITFASGVSIANNGAITLVANDTVANGVVNSGRSAGNAGINMSNTSTLTSNGNNITLMINTGAGLTNSTSSNIVLGSINAGAGTLTITNLGPTAGSGIVMPSTSNLLTAANIALNVSGAASGTGSIGTDFAPIRVTTTNIAANISNQTGGINIVSPSQGFNIGTVSTISGITNTPGQTSLTAAGAITDTAASTIAFLTLAAGFANSITLNNANDFTQVIVNSAANLTLTDIDDINFGNVSMGGAVNITTTNGNVTQSGGTTFSAPINSTFNTGTGVINLSNTGNTFGGLLTITAAGTSSFTNSIGFTLAGISLASGSNLTLTAAGDINQQSAFTTLNIGTGTVTLSATDGGSTRYNINFGSSNNTFGGARIVSGNIVTLRTQSGLNFTGGTSTVNGNLNVNAAGNIVQDSAISMATGTNAVFATTVGGISLTNASNNFANVAASSSAGSSNAISITDANALNIGGSGISTAGDVTLIATSFTQNSNAPIISDGTTTVGNGSTTSINLLAANNDFATLNLTGSSLANINELNNIVLGSIATNGMNLTAGGAITQTVGGFVNIAGTTSLITAGTNITLDNVNSSMNFSTVRFIGNNVSVYDDTGGITLGTSSIAGNLVVNSNNNNINNGGQVLVDGTTTLNAGSGAVDFDNADNRLRGAVMMTAASASLSNAEDVVLGASTIASGLTVVSAGQITDIDDITAATLTATSATGMILDAGHNISSINLTNTTSGVLTFTSALASTLTIAGLMQSSTEAATITNTGNITSSASPTIASGGNLLLYSTAGTTTLANAITATGATTIGLRGNDIAINANINNSGGTVNLIANADLFANAAGSGVQISTTELQAITAQNLGLSGVNVTAGALSLAADTTMTATNDINLNGAINNNYALNLSGGNDINISAAIGNTTPIKSLTVSGAGTTHLGANISTQGNTMTFDTPVLLTGNVVLTDSGTTGIIFNDTVDGNFNLGLTAANGDINFNALVGDSIRLAAVTVNNAVDFSSAELFNATSFTQSTGSGTTAFLSGLNTTNDISINTNGISGSYEGDAIILAAANNYTASVVAGSLTLGGQNGANITGTVAGLDGIAAALQTDLSIGATGSFYVNGCLVGTSCTGNDGSGSPTVTQNDQTLLPDENASDVNTQDDMCNYTDPVTQETKKAQGANCVNIDVKGKAEKPKLVQKLSPKPAPYKAASGVIVIPKALSPTLAFEQ